MLPRIAVTTMEQVFNAIGPARAYNVLEILLSLNISFVMAMVIGWTYRQTHGGFSYSRSFVQALVLAAITSCIMIIAIGNNLARGLGILGALALIRFRTPVRDPRDIIFLFASLATGIGSGAQVFGVAILGPTYFCLVAWILHKTPFASKRQFEGLLRFILADDDTDKILEVKKILADYTSSAELVALREAIQGAAKEYTYQIRLLDPAGRADMLNALQTVKGITEPNMVMQRSTVEI
jgi:uncharacterized membrane protein YhiD involved in acid resistance